VRLPSYPVGERAGGLKASAGPFFFSERGSEAGVHSFTLLTTSSCILGHGRLEHRGVIELTEFDERRCPSEQILLADDGAKGTCAPQNHSDGGPMNSQSGVF
jgi:hypothetical protein